MDIQLTEHKVPNMNYQKLFLSLSLSLSHISVCLYLPKFNLLLSSTYYLCKSLLAP
uniref:Uncharacterized protein n=1 Tax=Rhizophora mucronata TaxID=61149 RepID=A0A2P2L246_RHIMU